MGKTTAIEWTQATWNPWIGCHKVSEGCRNCYMFRDQKRYGNDPSVVRRTKPATFDAPLKWAKDPDGPRLVFVCSWSDFLIKEADEWREEALRVIRATPEITYQILTKRPERIPDTLGDQRGLSNVWMGVSVEDNTQLVRMVELVEWWPRLRWVSAEPLLGPLFMGYLLEAFDWVVAGGESGSNRRMELDWIRGVRDDCDTYYVPFFFKQWGGTRKVDGTWGGRELDGRTWDEMPEFA